MEIRVIDGNLEDALRRFKRLVSFDGVHPAVRFRETFPNITDRRREKMRRAVRRKRKREGRRAQFVQ